MIEFWKSLFSVDVGQEVREALVDNPEPLEAPEYVPLEKEDIQPIIDLYSEMNRLQMRVGQLTVDYERRKKDILEVLDDLRDRTQETVDNLRDTYHIPEDDDHYVLNLPTKDQPQASFTREPPKD